jgi:hypothetical protein
MQQIMNDRTYNILKWVAQVFLPAVGAFYFALAPLWGFPKVEEVLGTIVALDTLLGVLLGVSTRVYNSDPRNFDGIIRVLDREDGGKTFDMNLNHIEDPRELANQNRVTFAIQKGSQGKHSL